MLKLVGKMLGLIIDEVKKVQILNLEIFLRLPEEENYINIIWNKKATIIRYVVQPFFILFFFMELVLILF